MIRWGILGPARIARKNWKAIRNSGNGTVVAVASRDKQRAQALVDECQPQAPFDNVPHTLGSYEALLGCKDVNAVYVPLPTGLRKEWLIRAAEAGKHVLCEKPCAVSAADLRAVLEACERNQVQFMDGVMFMHSRRLGKIREVLDDGVTIGKIKRITCAFSFGAAPEFFTSNIRSQSVLEPYGCLGDLGWYCIRFILWAMNWQLPEHVVGRLLTEHKHPDSPASVPVEFSAELFFPGGVSSSFYCAFVTALQQWAIIGGTTGGLRVPDFVLPSFGDEVAFETGTPTFKDFRMDPNIRRWALPEHSNGFPDSQETNMFRAFSEQIASGKLNPLWPEMAMKTQQVMEMALESARAKEI